MTGLILNFAIIFSIGLLFLSQGHTAPSQDEEISSHPEEYELQGETQEVQPMNTHSPKVGDQVFDQNGRPTKTVQEAMTIYRELRSAPEQRKQPQQGKE